MVREINIEEQPGKVVGRRRAPADPLRSSRDTKREAEAWSRAFDRPFVPRGVYRFRTFEEADEWMWAMLSRPSASRR
ncbi:MAG: hypothetical protein HY907_12835 [Deltaproteobacteria bacterium]|nr:hypothetical protein [Deltaproteobacteria bacterium]